MAWSAIDGHVPHTRAPVDKAVVARLCTSGDVDAMVAASGLNLDEHVDA